MAKVFIVGLELEGTGGWNWYPLKCNADACWRSDMEILEDFETGTLYRGALEVPDNLDRDGITNFVENYICDNDFENTPLEDKEIIHKGGVTECPVCGSSDLKPDHDYGGSMLNCNNCLSEFTRDGDVTLNTRELK